jgi:serine/threonine protein phosphatase 1
MNKRWVIADIHGCANTLKVLVEEKIKLSKSDELYFLGDYIDRGPGSKEVIDYIWQLCKEGYLVKPLKGNHEDLLVNLYDKEKRSIRPFSFLYSNRNRKSWFAMGGKETLKSFQIHSPRQIPMEYIEWMRGLDYYVILEKFILVHAGLNFQLDNPFIDTGSMLWIREFDVIPDKTGNRKIIHGHVPISLQFIDHSIKNSYYQFIDLDNGPYLTGQSGYGNLVALELTNMELVVQDNRDL